MLIDRRRGNEDDACSMSSNLRMRDDLDQIVLVLGKWDMLLVRCVLQRGVIGSKEDGLGGSVLVQTHYVSFPAPFTFNIQGGRAITDS